MKIKKKIGGWVGGSGQGECEQRSEIFLKIKKNPGRGGGGSGWGRSGWMRTKK